MGFPDASISTKTYHDPPVPNVAEYLLAEKDPTAVALRFPQSTHSYGALTAKVAQVAGCLRRICAQKGDRVLLIGDNSFFWAACYLGIMQAGLVCVPVPANSEVRDLRYALDTAMAQIVCAQGSVVVAHAVSFAGRHLLTDR